MKTLYRFIVCSFMLVLFAGCVKDEVVLDDIQYELTARMEMDAKTRTSLSGLQGEMYYPLWSAGDEIAVFVDGDPAPSKFVLSSGEGATKATFAGSRMGNDYRALYPYSDTAGMENGILYYTLPSVQQYVAGSFGPGCYPMVARGTSEGLDFMNLCSVMKISITGEAALRSITLKAKDETVYLSGTASVDSNYDAYPHLQMLEGGSNSVTLDCKGTELAKDSATDFHIVLPAQTYKGGFDIIIDAYTDTIVKSVSSDLEFKRSRIRHLKGMELEAEKPEINYDAIPDNEIWYVMSDGTIYDIYLTTKQYGHQPFDAKVISNTYKNGYGIIKFDAPVTKINDHTFGNSWAANMTELYLPDCIEYIGTGAIHLTGLTTLHIPKSLKCVGSYGLNNLYLENFSGEHVSEDGRSVIIEDGFMIDYGNIMTPVKNYFAAFAPAGITEYTLPKNVEVLGWYAFAWCPELRKITFNEGLKTIKGDCFMGTNLDCEIILPSTLESLDSYAFHSCSGIKGFYGNEKFHTSDNRCLIALQDNPSVPQSWHGTWIVSFVGTDLSEYTIPDGIVGIENYAFGNKENLISITIPSSVVFIGPHAFDQCSNLEAVYGPNVSEDNRVFIYDNVFGPVIARKNMPVNYHIQDDVTSIGYSAFNGCEQVESITMGDQINVIGGYAFSWCPNLRSITLSANLKMIGDKNGWFSGNNPFLFSENLEEIYCRALVPPEYYDEQMSKFDKLKFYVPSTSLHLYKSHDGWMQYADYMVGYEFTDLPELDYYTSTDYTQDGTTVQMQKATEGNGINIVLMGDGYSDRQIADGSYKADMEYVYSNLFTKEPYKSYKHLFNVSYVNVVSATEGFEYGNTALSCGFGNGTYVYGNDNAVFKYAQKVVDESKIDETLMIVVMNSNNYAGTCFMYYPNSSGTDYGKGPAVAYFPKGESSEVFAQLLHHEACGHGFAKLADEYAYEYMGAVPSEEVENTKNQQSLYGWWKNVDFTNDPAQVRWKKFLEDTRYAKEGLGVFEGGLTYWSGVWRPTENSIMRYNQGEFNAPSREAIYYRMHKLAYGEEWQYDYEKFVEYDAVNYNAQAAPTTKVSPLRPKQQLHPPVVIKKSWREAE